jgi:hypothetical protein
MRRVAFGFSGIYDADEAGRILEGTVAAPQSVPAVSAPQQSIDELDKQIQMLRLRVDQLGMDTLESFISERFKGADYDYVMAGVKAQAETPVFEAEVVHQEEPEMATTVDEATIGVTRTSTNQNRHPAAFAAGPVTGGCMSKAYKIIPA